MSQLIFLECGSSDGRHLPCALCYHGVRCQNACDRSIHHQIAAGHDIPRDRGRGDVGGAMKEDCAGTDSRDLVVSDSDPIVQPADENAAHVQRRERSGDPRDAGLDRIVVHDDVRRTSRRTLGAADADSRRKETAGPGLYAPVVRDAYIISDRGQESEYARGNPVSLNLIPTDTYFASRKAYSRLILPVRSEENSYATGADDAISFHEYVLGDACSNVDDGDRIVVGILNEILAYDELAPGPPYLDAASLGEPIVLDAAVVTVQQEDVLTLRRRHAAGNGTVMEAIRPHPYSLRASRRARVHVDDS